VIKFTPATTAEGAGDAVKAVTFFEKKVTKKLSVLRALTTLLPKPAGSKVFSPSGGPVLFLQEKKVFLAS
jgi:hypothetical protein